MELPSAKLIVLLVFVVSTLFVHYRGKVRYGFWRQLTNYSTFLAPYSSLMYLFSKVRTTPVLEEDDLPELAPLRSSWKTIRDEALALRERGSMRSAAKHDDISFNSFFKRGWKRFYLKWYDDILPTARERCPKTVELVESIPSVNAALFVSMAPKSRLPRHRDPFAGSLRYHLGLVTPNSDACHIEIDGTPWSWRDGEVLLFDATYVHRPVNQTDEERILLFCDIARPLRTPVVRGLNRFVTRNIVKITAARNVDTEKIGFVNRIAGRLHVLRKLSKQLRNHHPRTYYTSAYAAKAALGLGVLYLVFHDVVLAG